MHIAVEGCSHGELDIIYNTISRLEKIHNFKIELLLCCGDFQSVRNEGDLKCMAVPTKYMQMQDFHKYYSGEKKAPVLTIFIGGNHEASNYLQELPYGGWVAPNIYYLGYAGVVRYGDLRIGGLSGIYKGSDYLKGRFEKSPYSSSSLRSVYHVRNLEVFRLKQLSGNLDIFMSHDWPRGIYHYGNIKQLLKFKKHFTTEVKNNTLGSRPAEDIMKKLKPDYWFSGHLHVKFSAVMKHEATSSSKRKVTKFLALDKCLPRREFLQVLELPISSPTSPELSHDAEWLSVLRLTNHLLSTNCQPVYMPGPGAGERYNFTPTAEEIEETIEKLGGSLMIPTTNFVKTAESFKLTSNRLPNMNFVSMPQPLVNPQTTKLCSQLGIDDPVGKVNNQSRRSPNYPSRTTKLNNVGSAGPWNKSEMNITLNSSNNVTSDSFNISTNPEEIDLNDDDEIEFSKDEETGDIIMEIPTFVVKDDASTIENISPIRGEKIPPPTRNIFSSPLSSSPRLSAESEERKGKLPLSNPKKSSYSPLITRDCSRENTPSPKPSQGGESTSSEASPPSFTTAFAPLSISSQSEEESDSTGRSASQKRESSCDESDLFSPNPSSQTDVGATPTRKNKKLKRRNDSIYSSSEDV